MRYTVYYLIEARAVLIERAGACDDPDVACLLSDPVMLSHQEHHSRFTAGDHAHVIKILFLAQLKDYEPFRSDDGFEALFGSSQLTGELFDRWWTIRRLHLDDSADSLVPLLKQVAHLVRRGESELVDQWLDRALTRPDDAQDAC